jgi:hypothetical protein
VIIRYSGASKNPTYTGTMATVSSGGFTTHYLVNSGTFTA